LATRATTSSLISPDPRHDRLFAGVEVLLEVEEVGAAGAGQVVARHRADRRLEVLGTRILPGW
jgi:hypothetical protein